MHETNYKKLSVVFESVRFERATNIAEQGYYLLEIKLMRKLKEESWLIMFYL